MGKVLELHHWHTGTRVQSCRLSNLGDFRKNFGCRRISRQRKTKQYHKSQIYNQTKPYFAKIALISLENRTELYKLARLEQNLLFSASNRSGVAVNFFTTFLHRWTQGCVTHSECCNVHVDCKQQPSVRVQDPAPLTFLMRKWSKD